MLLMNGEVFICPLATAAGYQKQKPKKKTEIKRKQLINNIDLKLSTELN